MGKILDEFMCHDCKRRREFYTKRIVREGRIDNLIYITEDGDTILLEAIDFKDEELLAKITGSVFAFLNCMPKFGKFEIEKFVADELRNAIFVTHDLSYLFNTSVICEDVYISSERVRKALMAILKEVPGKRCKTYELNI